MTKNYSTFYPIQLSLSSQKYGMEIRDPEKSRVKNHLIADLDSQHCQHSVRYRRLLCKYQFLMMVGTVPLEPQKEKEKTLTIDITKQSLKATY